MDQPELTALLPAVVALRESVDRLSDKITELQAYGRRTRRYVWRGWVAGGVIVLLTVGQIYTSQRVQTNSAAVQRINDRAVITCQTSNNARALNRQLWDYVLTFPDVRQLNPSERAQRDYQITQFRAFIAKTFADQDCSKMNQPVTSTVK